LAVWVYYQKYRHTVTRRKAIGGKSRDISDMAQCIFDTQCQKCFCITFEKSNKTPTSPDTNRKRKREYMKRTISVMLGKGSVNHNSRHYIASNIDSDRSQFNISYCNIPIKGVYHELFDDALQRYNAKQTRADRCINDYYEKI